MNALPTGPRMYSAAELAARELKPRPWLVRDWLPANQVSSIDGDGGAGKTTLGLQLCAAAATGRSWLDQPVARGPAIYLASEDDLDELHRRVDAIGVHLGVSYEDMADLHLWPLAIEDPALVAPGREDTIVATERWAQLVAGVKAIKPAVVVLDSRADVFGGQEISRTQARGFIGMLRRLAIDHETAVVILGHPSLSGMSSGSGSSGSTHWRNAVRAGLYLRRGDDDGPPDRKVLELMKANYGPTGLALNPRWCAGVYVPEEGAAPRDRASAEAEVDGLFLHMLSRYEAQGRYVGDKPSSNYAPTVFSRDPTSGGVRRDAFVKAMNRLFEAGRLRVAETGRKGREVRKLVAVEP